MPEQLSWQPLDGLRVGLVGASRALRFAGRTLAAIGADVIRLAPPGADPPPAADPARGGRSDREDRLSHWLDEHVDVVPLAAELPAGERLAGAALVICDAAHAGSCPSGRPLVRIDMGVGDGMPSCGLTAAARGGVAVAAGAADGYALGLPFDLADYATGLVACVAALDALETSAAGAEVSAVRVLATFAGSNALVYEPYGIPWTRERRRASQCGGPYPYGLWRAADGYVCAIVRTRQEWERLLDALGRPAWSRDERYANLRRNGALYADELDALIERWTSTRTRAQLVELAERYGLPMAPVRSVAEVLDDVHLRESGVLSPGEGTRPPRPGLPFAAGAAPRGGPSRTAAARPLAGAHVLDFGRVWSGPMVGAALADMGADVVKIEHHERPDNARLRGRPEPGWIEHDAVDSLEAVPYFLNLNHGKRSVALDLSEPAGFEVARRLLAEADIVIENFGSRVLERLGLGYDDLVAESPGLIWISMPSRLDGSPAMRGYAPTLSSYSGLESAIGYPGDLTGMMTFGFCDPVAGTWGQLAALAAWRERNRTGRGRHVRLGQLEGLVALLGEQYELFDRTAEDGPAGNVHEYFAPYGCFQTADGHEVAVAVLDDEQRRALGGLLGCAAQPEVLGSRLREYVAGATRDEVVGTLRGAVACEPVASIRETRADPVLLEMGMLAELDHPLAGRHLVYTQPWSRDGAPLPVHVPAPLLGHDSEDVPAEWSR